MVLIYVPHDILFIYSYSTKVNFSDDPNDPDDCDIAASAAINFSMHMSDIV